MHPSLSAFIRQFAAVVCAALAPVVLTTFVTVPMSLGAFPGKTAQTGVAVERHLT